MSPRLNSYGHSVEDHCEEKRRKDTEADEIDLKCIHSNKLEPIVGEAMPYNGQQLIFVL